jgi:Raf kinase inhibitor-like YbhB/YbcL family protein
MRVLCPALLSGKYLPTKCAHRNVKGGQNVSPGVEWTDVPPGTKSFVLSIIDRHPVANNWVHWQLVNIPPSVREIPERASGAFRVLPAECMELRNSYGENGYGGPNPPRGTGAHEYEITVHALDLPVLSLGPFATLTECLAAMQGHVLTTASIFGTFQQ